MTHVAIIDYGLCNLDSVARAVEECGGSPQVTENPDDLSNASHIILPGVGAFPDAMENLRRDGMHEAIREEAGLVPFLGICLGMQLMASIGTEVRETKGLGLIEGTVMRLERDSESTRIPHVGWNEVNHDGTSPLLAGIEPGKDFYFVHSYHLECDGDEAIATTPYAGGFISVVGRGSIFGTQFHPEKSQKAGFQFLRNFLSM